MLYPKWILKLITTGTAAETGRRHEEASEVLIISGCWLHPL